MLGKNSVFTVTASCRRGSAQRANTSKIDRIGMGAKRYSYTTRVNSSHSALAMRSSSRTRSQGISTSAIYGKGANPRVNDLSIQALSSGSRLLDSRLVAPRQDSACRREGLGAFSLSIARNRYVDEHGLRPGHNDFAGMAEETGFGDRESDPDFLDLGERPRPYPGDDKEMPPTSDWYAEGFGIDDDVGQAPIVHQQVMEAPFIEGRTP